MLLTGCQQCNIETTEVCNKFGCICKDGFFGKTCDESKFVNEIMLINHTFQNKYCLQNANASTTNSGRSPASKRKKMTKESTSPKTKFLTPYPKKK